MKLLSRGILLVALAPLGCKEKLPPPVEKPSYNAEAITSALMARCDKNSDGNLEGSELDECPALRFALPHIDTDKDRRISRAELLARITAYQNAGASVVLLSVVVKKGGEFAEGYTVTFTPDPAFGGLLKPATGKTDIRGYVVLKAEGAEAFGVPAGFYTVTITDATGANVTKTTLGREVFNDGRNSGDLLEFSF